MTLPQVWPVEKKDYLENENPINFFT